MAGASSILNRITSMENEFETNEDIFGEEIPLDGSTQQLVDEICARMVLFAEELAGHELFDYQKHLILRIFESVITGDAETVTGLQARQSGKTETVGCAVATMMILLPKLAPMFPELLGKFEKGVWVGCFAPTGDLSDIIFSRIVDRLTSENATEIMLDPEINDEVGGRGKIIRLKNSGSFCRKQTAHPSAKIEGSSYHLVVIDESQDCDDTVVRKSIHPMLAFYAGTIVKIGTPSTRKGDFYKQIQLNKRRQVQRGSKQNHFEANWRACARNNKNYALFVKKEIERLGEESDEFQMAYNLKWLLDRGMFVSASVLDPDDPEFLGDKSMQIVDQWYATHVVVGIDPARELDSTVVTVLWVDWEREDAFGYRHHRILNWLEITGEKWEEQYAQIYHFLQNYNVLKIGVDAQGMGDAVAERLQVVMGPYIEVEKFDSTRPAQSARWKNLQSLMQRRMLMWPAHAWTRRLRTYRRFSQQMADAEKHYFGDHMMVEAPEEAGAHDDYVDSLAIAAMTSTYDEMPEVETVVNPFATHRRR